MRNPRTALSGTELSILVLSDVRRTGIIVDIDLGAASSERTLARTN
jgi:hypothetical protein